MDGDLLTRLQQRGQFVPGRQGHGPSFRSTGVVQRSFSIG